MSSLAPSATESSATTQATLNLSATSMSSMSKYTDLLSIPTSTPMTTSSQLNTPVMRSPADDYQP